MSVTFDIDGNRQTFFSAPTTTAAATVYTVPSGVRECTLVAVNIAATTGGAAATVWINNGVTDYPLLDAKTISANTTETFEFGSPPIHEGWSIKVKDGTGSKLTFAVIIAEQYRL